MRSLVVILVGIGLLLLSGCAGSTPPAPTSTQLAGAEPSPPPTAPTPVPLPTPEPAVATITSAEELIGLWHDAHPGGFMGDTFARYSADGTVRGASSLEKLDTEPRFVSEYWFENGVFFQRDTAGLPGWDMCVKDGFIGQYRLEVLASGNVRTVLIEDGCEIRAWFKDGAEIVRVP
jgi:hypothetical protein